MRCTHLFRQLTRLVGAVEDFVIEDGKVESQTEADRVGRLHLVLADVKCVLKINK